MNRILHEEPEFSETFISHLLTRSIWIEEDLVDHLFNSSEKRLARISLLLANFGKDGRPEEVIPNISLETLTKNGRDDSLQSQPLSEQIPQTRFHRIRRRPAWNARSHLAAERPLLRVPRDPGS